MAAVPRRPSPERLPVRQHNTTLGTPWKALRNQRDDMWVGQTVLIISSVPPAPAPCVGRHDTEDVLMLRLVDAMLKLVPSSAAAILR